MTNVAFDLVSRQARAWEREDVDAVVAAFAEDGVFIAPGGRWQGHAEIAEAFAAFWATVTKVEVMVWRAFICGDQGAAEWTWTETRLDGSEHQVDDAIVFTLRNGKISYWREYFDTANF